MAFSWGIRGKPVPIQKLLTMLVLGIVTPILALTITLAWRVADAERRVIEARRYDQVNNLTFLIDGEIAAIELLAHTLARSPEMTGENFQDFRERAKEITGDRIALIAVISQSGQQVMSTAFSANEPLPMSQNMNFLKTVFEGQSAVSDILIGTAAKRPIISVALPVVIDGQVKYALSAVVFSERFSAFFAKAGISPNWPAAIVDHEGRFIARNIGPDGTTGSLARPEARIAARGAETRGTFANVSLEGTPTESAFWRSSLTGWTSVVAVPTDALYASYYRAMILSLAFAALAAVVAFVCATVVARRVASEVRQLGDAATALVDGSPLNLTCPTVLEFREVQAAYEHAEKLALEKSQDEAHIKFLAHELAHRAKNLLTVVQGMSRFIIRSTPTFDQYSKEFDGRLKSLAVSQDLLFEPARGSDLDALLRQQLAPFPADGVQIGTECNRFRVHPALVQPLGMAIYELATNSVKYGSMSLESGRVKVSCSPAVEGMTISWQERGGPEVIEPPSRKGFGSFVLRDYVASSVGGSVEIQYEGGLRWSLFVPASHLLPSGDDRDICNHPVGEMTSSHMGEGSPAPRHGKFETTD